jgi:hypothetical protein
MINVPISSAEDRVFEAWSGQAKDYEIEMCCFSAKHAALRRNNNDWLALNQDNLPEWSEMSIRTRQLFQWVNNIKKNKKNVLV